MYKYTIYCTEEQIKKAIELGAPIDVLDTESQLEGRRAACGGVPCFGSFDDYLNKDKYPNICVLEIDDERYAYIIPTAEQMMGWLEEQGIVMDVSGAFSHNNEPTFAWRIGFRFNHFESDAILYSSREEATHVAIDYALTYLIDGRTPVDVINEEKEE